MAWATARNPPSAAHDHQQRVHRDREGQEQNAGDAQDQPDDQHAEGGQHQDLTQQAR